MRTIDHASVLLFRGYKFFIYLNDEVLHVFDIWLVQLVPSSGIPFEIGGRDCRKTSALTDFTLGHSFKQLLLFFDEFISMNVFVMASRDRPWGRNDFMVTPKKSLTKDRNKRQTLGERLSQ